MLRRVGRGQVTCIRSPAPAEHLRWCAAVHRKVEGLAAVTGYAAAESRALDATCYGTLTHCSHCDTQEYRHPAA